MMMIAAIPIAMALLIGASQDGAPADRSSVAISDECAIIGVVAREVHRLDKAPSPPLRASATYLPDCPWSAMGIQMTPPNPEMRSSWINFARPRIDGATAVVRTGIMRRPMAGRGAECTLVREPAGWRLQKCVRTWVT